MDKEKRKNTKKIIFYLLCVLVMSCKNNENKYKIFEINDSLINDYYIIKTLDLNNDTINILSEKEIRYKKGEKIENNKSYNFKLKLIKKEDFSDINVRKNIDIYLDGHLIVSGNNSFKYYRALNLKDLYIIQE